MFFIGNYGSCPLVIPGREQDRVTALPPPNETGHVKAINRLLTGSQASEQPVYSLYIATLIGSW